MGDTEVLNHQLGFVSSDAHPETLFPLFIHEADALLLLSPCDPRSKVKLFDQALSALGSAESSPGILIDQHGRLTFGAVKGNTMANGDVKGFDLSAQPREWMGRFSRSPEEALTTASLIAAALDGVAKAWWNEEAGADVASMLVSDDGETKLAGPMPTATPWEA